jgi:hypothetical protein
MSLEWTFTSGSFRSAQQVLLALILLRMSVSCPYAGGLCSRKVVLIELPCA